MKRFLVLSLSMATLFGSMTIASAQQCRLTGFGQLPSNTPLALGEIMYYYAANFPDVGQALVSARDAWDSTDAVNRIGDWDGFHRDRTAPAAGPCRSVRSISTVPTARRSTPIEIWATCHQPPWRS